MSKHSHDHSIYEPRPLDGGAIRVALSGLGRAGWNIHAKALSVMQGGFTIVAAADPDLDRREEAKQTLGCETFETYAEMLANSDAELFVIASPSHLHTEQALAALESNRHVVCEKPFARSADEAEAMIEAARSHKRIIAPFQNRRFEAHYRKVQEIVQSGELGELLQIRMCWHRFTRRWDWQAMRQFGGGALFNNGTHLLDQALALMSDSEPEIFIDLRRGLSLGDAEEHMKLILRDPAGPTIDIEYTNASAFEQDRWHIMGTAGGLKGNPDHLEWKTVDWATMPERPLDPGPAEDRLYPSEEINWQPHSWMPDASAKHPYQLLYENVHDAICNGASLVVTPESAVRYMRIVERCSERIPELVQTKGQSCFRV